MTRRMMDLRSGRNTAGTQPGGKQHPDNTTCSNTSR